PHPPHATTSPRSSTSRVAIAVNCTLGLAGCLRSAHSRPGCRTLPCAAAKSFILRGDIPTVMEVLMKFRALVLGGALAVGLASAWPAKTTVAAQGRGGGAPPDAAAQGGGRGGRGQAAPAPTAPYQPSTYTPPKSAYVPPKTPWGDPDLQGVYD